MKIAFTIPRLTYSGAPKMLAWVANQMAKKGHEVHIITFFSEEQARILHDSITVHPLKVVQSGSRLVRNTTGMLKTIIKLHRTIKSLNSDIVVSFLDSVSYVYLPIGKLLTKSNFIVSERGDPYAYKDKLAKIKFNLMKFAHGCVFQTHGAQVFFEKYPKIYNNSVVIPNPVVVNEEIISMQNNIPAPEERDNRIVTVARLSLIQKRQDILLQAFDVFHKNHPDYKLVIYGDGEDYEKIQCMIEQLNLSECVELAGRTDNVEKEIFHASASVLTSDYEGIPNALIEALSIGVPSVSTDCSPGGAALLIKDGENGFLVPRGDVNAIAEKLSLVVSDTNISKRFSENGPQIITEFSEDVIADKWELFLKNIVKKGERNG